MPSPLCISSPFRLICCSDVWLNNGSIVFVLSVSDRNENKQATLFNSDWLTANRQSLTDSSTNRFLAVLSSQFVTESRRLIADNVDASRSATPDPRRTWALQQPHKQATHVGASHRSLAPLHSIVVDRIVARVPSRWAVSIDRTETDQAAKGQGRLSTNAPRRRNVRCCR